MHPFFPIKFVAGKYLVFFFFFFFFFFFRKSAFKYPPGGKVLWRYKSPCSPDGSYLLKDSEFIIINIIIILFLYVLLFVLILLFRKHGSAWMILTSKASMCIRMVHRWITLSGIPINQLTPAAIVFICWNMNQWRFFTVRTNSTTIYVNVPFPL